MKKILIVRTDRIGDVVMITPVIRELRKTYPGSFIGALVTSYTSDILSNNPHLDTIIIDDLSEGSFNKVVREIRTHKFTDGLLTWPIKRAAYQMFLAGVKNRIGVGRKLYEVITFMKSVSRNDYIPLRHEADYCMDLARAIGVETNNLTPEIFLTEDEKADGENFLLSKGIPNNGKRIIVHTGYGHSSPNWSEEKYLGLITKILSFDENANIILTAPEMSADFLTNVNSLKSNNIFNVSKDFPRLRDLIKTISACNVLVSSSTGPMHLASALGIPTVSIFCHNAMCRIDRWGALGEKAHNIEVNAAFCESHCKQDVSKCEIDQAISTSQVLDKILKIIN